MKGMSADQLAAQHHLSGWKVGALFMEPGTGKTRVAVEIVNSSPCDLCVWIGPLNTIRPREGMPSVADEVGKWGGFAMDSVYIGVESISSSDRIWLDLLERVEQSRCPFVVVDESLKIKNAEAKRTKRLLQLGELVEYKLILNGTPLTRNLLDLWPQMQFISPLILNMTINRFKDTFCNYKIVTKRFGFKTYSKEYITGYENVDYLYSLIRHYVYECDLHMNISQRYEEVRYTIGEEEKAAYRELKAYYLSDETLEWKNNNIFLEMTQKMQHSYCVTAAKFDAVAALFKRIDEGRTIIFCKYIKSREACEKAFPRAKVLSYQRESFGLNLQTYCNTIYFDKIWDYALRIQSGRRTFRTGQNEDCRYFDLTGDVGLEKLIDKNIQKKIGLTEYFKSKTKEQIMEEL